jgi:hypothetical protein
MSDNSELIAHHLQALRQKWLDVDSQFPDHVEVELISREEADNRRAHLQIHVRIFAAELARMYGAEGYPDDYTWMCLQDSADFLVEDVKRAFDRQRLTHSLDAPPDPDDGGHA